MNIVPRLFEVDAKERSRPYRIAMQENVSNVRGPFGIPRAPRAAPTKGGKGTGDAIVSSPKLVADFVREEFDSEADIDVCEQFWHCETARQR